MIGIRTRRTLGEHLDTAAAKRWMGRGLGGILCYGRCPKTTVPRKRLDGELPEVVKWDGWTDSERRPRPGMPSTHWKPRAPCFFTVRAPAGVDALPQPPLRVKLAAAALALFRDTKTSGPIPAPDSFSASLVGGDSHQSSLGRAPRPPSFLAQSVCQQRAVLGASLPSIDRGQITSTTPNITILA